MSAQLGNSGQNFIVGGLIDDTKISGMPTPFFMSASKVSMEARSATFNTLPSPL